MTRLTRAVRPALLLLVLASSTAEAQTRPLVVGSSATYRPFAYETAAREIVGFDVDIIKAIAQRTGLTLKIVNTPFTGVFAALNNGDLDLIISGVTINDRRKQSYDFTAPYFEARQLIAVHKNSTVKSLQDLAGKKVGVVTGSTGDDVASKRVGICCGDNKLQSFMMAKRHLQLIRFDWENSEKRNLKEVSWRQCISSPSRATRRS